MSRIDLYPTIPAAPGTVALAVWYKLGDAPPVETDIVVYPSSVVAWRVVDERARPIVVDFPGDAMLLVEMPDGSLCAPWAQTQYATLSAAKAELLEFAKHEWARIHRPPRVRDAREREIDRLLVEPA